MKNNFIDENIFKKDDIGMLSSNEKLINSSCVTIQNVDYTPLQASIIYNSTKIRDFILKQSKTDINIQNSRGENVLITAIINKAPLTFIKELSRRNIDICLPINSKFSSIMDFANPDWEGYSELNHMVQRKKSYNFNYKKQNLEKKIESEVENLEEKELESYDNYLKAQLDNESIEEQKKKDDLSKIILNSDQLNSINTDKASTNITKSFFQVVKSKQELELSNQISTKKNTSHRISKSIAVPKNLIRSASQIYTKDLNKDFNQLDHCKQEITSLSQDSKVSFKSFEAKNKVKHELDLKSMQSIVTNDRTHVEINENDDVRDQDISTELFPEKKTKQSEKNAKTELITKKMIKNEDNNSNKRDKIYDKYSGVDHEYMLFIGHQLNESIETSKKFFTCACCAGTRPWKSET